MSEETNIDALRHLMEKATAGPIMATERSGYHELLAPDEGCDWYGVPKHHAIAYIDTEIDEGEQAANAALFTAAINALPSLLTELEALRASRGRMVEAQASFKTAVADLGKGDAVQWQGTEDDQHAERMKACKARCQRWGDCDERDGSCAECDSDMAEALETTASMKRRLRNYEARVDRFLQSDGLRAALAALQPAEDCGEGKAWLRN